MATHQPPSGFGRALWVAGLIGTNVLTFLATLLFAQAVWSYNNTATAGQTATPGGAATTQPSTRPTTQPANGSPLIEVVNAAPADDNPLADLVGKLTTSDGDGTYDHAAYDAILGDVVQGELVDYGRLKAEHSAELDGYLDGIASMDEAALLSLSRDAQLALLINLYNAEMIDTVAERLTSGYGVGEDDFAVFDEPLVTLAGLTFSLNDLEHRLIREAFDEPGIHAALVCAAMSCPPLLPDAYEAATVRRTLEDNVRRWIDGPRNEIDHPARTLRLSSIFDWYGVDFADGDVAAFVDGYTDRDVSGYAVEFLPYDWTLNDVD